MIVTAPSFAEYFHLTGSRRQQPFENLDGRRLAGAVRAEQAETLRGLNLQVEPVHGIDDAFATAVLFVQVTTEDGRRHAGIIVAELAPAEMDGNDGKSPGWLVSARLLAHNS